MIVQLLALQRSSRRTHAVNVASSGDVADVVALVRAAWGTEAGDPDCMWVSHNEPASDSNSGPVPANFRPLCAMGQPVVQQCFADWLRDEGVCIPVFPEPLYMLLCPAGCSPQDNAEAADDHDQSDAPSRESSRERSRESSCERSREQSCEAHEPVSRAHLPRREPPMQYNGAAAGSDDDLDEGPSERSKCARPTQRNGAVHAFSQYFSEDEEHDTPSGEDEARGGGSLHTMTYAVGPDRP